MKYLSVIKPLIAKFKYTMTVLVLGVIAISGALLVQAAESPVITTEARNSANIATTSVAVGSEVHARVVLSAATSSSPIPQGTVDFNLYANTSCLGTPLTQSGVALVSGVADSATTSISASGLSYKVHYNGQADVYAAEDGSCTPVTAIQAPPSTPTTGHLIVDQVTKPLGDATVFSFDAVGTGYSDFSLSGTSTPNDQVLAPGAYSITQAAVSGYALTKATCKTNGGSAIVYVPGSTLSLSAGDSVYCVFTTTKDGVTGGEVTAKKTKLQLNDELIAFLRSLGFTGDVSINREKGEKHLDDDDDDEDDNRGHGNDNDHDDDDNPGRGNGHHGGERGHEREGNDD